jgi:hypothetical protein
VWGFGHPTQELAQLFISNIPNDRAQERRVLRAYADALAQALEESGLQYPYAELERDVEVAQLDVLAAEMFRRGASETPAKVKRMVQKQGEVISSVQSAPTQWCAPPGPLRRRLAWTTLTARPKCGLPM